MNGVGQTDLLLTTVPDGVAPVRDSALKTAATQPRRRGFTGASLWLRGAAAVLGLLAGAAAAVSWQAQYVMVADIKNCRILLISPNKHTSQIGHTGVCRHDPAHGYLALPNGDAPSADGRYATITEITGSWVHVFPLPAFQTESSLR